MFPAVRIVENKKVKIRLSKILFNICFIALTVFLLAGNASTANGGCCVPSCTSPSVINGTEVCETQGDVYHSDSCSSVSACGGGGGGSGECAPGFTKYSGVCFPDNTGLSEAPVITIVINVMQWILGIFGFIALIAFAVSGIQYLISAGNETAIETAKRNMKWSIIGVVVGLGGLVIVWAVDWALRGFAYF